MLNLVHTETPTERKKNPVCSLSLSPALPCSLDLSPEALGFVDKELACLSQGAEEILLQTQLVAILENFAAINVRLHTNSGGGRGKKKGFVKQCRPFFFSFCFAQLVCI